MDRIRCLIIALLLGILSFLSIAQDKSKNDPIELLHADTYRVYKVSDSLEYRFLVGNVFIKQKDVFFMSDSVVQDIHNKQIQCFGKNQIIKDDTNRVFADYIRYFTNTKMAYLDKNVILKSGITTLETPDAVYDAKSNIFSFEHTGKLRKDSIVITSQRGYYDQVLNKSVFAINAHLIHAQFILYADSLAFYPSKNTLEFISPSVINSKDNHKKMYTTSGIYNTQQQYLLLTKRSFIWDTTSCAIADTIKNFKNQNKTYLYGDAYVFDTSKKNILVAQYIFLNDSTKEALATNYPYWIYYTNKDTTILRGDTLISKSLKTLDSGRYHPLRIKVDSATNKNDLKYLIAYHQVRAYSDSMQIYCDSMFFSNEDSVMRLIRRPILWNDNNQITGDTIYLYFNHQEPEKMHIPHYSFVIKKEFDTSTYSQVKSESNWTYFSKDAIDSTWFLNNVQTIYYAKDDSNALTSISYITADSAFVKFKESKIVRLKFIHNYKGMHYPPLKYPEDKRFLENFKRLDTLRPLSRAWILNFDRQNANYILKLVPPQPFFPQTVIKRPEEDYLLVAPRKKNKPTQ